MKDLAIRALKEAGKILMENFGKANKVMVKGDRNLVTDVDLQVEKRIVELIKEKYPHHGILSEEQKEIKGSADYRWIIDPLDGTHNYIYGVDIFGISIALEYRGEVILGAIYIPKTDELYFAEKGGKAYVNGKRIRVSQRRLNQASMTFDSSLRLNPGTMLNNLGTLAKKVFNIRMFGSTVRELSFIAEGKLDLAVEYHDKPWDFVAGALLVEEAGGKVTDFSGKPWTPRSGRYIASNGVFHEEIIKILSNTSL